jgi:hypothetical protein
MVRFFGYYCYPGRLIPLAYLIGGIDPGYPIPDNYIMHKRLTLKSDGLIENNT